MRYWKGKFQCLCIICSRPIFVRTWHWRVNESEQSPVCMECWWDHLDGAARKAEAMRRRE